MILADSSAWVEFIRGTSSGVARRVTELVTENTQLAVTEPVVAEIASGARSDRQEFDHRRLLGRCAHLSFDSTVDFDGASRIYRRCRTVGVTPRGLIDCMIAAVALRHEATLLAWDADIARIAQVMDIDLDAASLRAS